jgi:hypothetical protein
MEARQNEALARAIRELAGLLGQAGRREAAAVLDEEAASIAAGVSPRGLSALRRMNAIRAGIAAAADVEAGAVNRTQVDALVRDITRAMAQN